MIFQYTHTLSYRKFNFGQSVMVRVKLVNDKNSIAMTQSPMLVRETETDWRRNWMRRGNVRISVCLKSDHISEKER